MADNCLGLESCWSFRPSSSPSSSSFPDSLWSITESFTRDNDALTRAFQISLSDASSAGSPPLPDTRLPAIPPRPEPATRNTLPCSASGRISKRKSRASKKSPTTYITADPANFRQMVQQVTGVRFGEPGQMPVESLVRPEPLRGGLVDRVGFGLMQGSAGCLPTLDTSALLLDRARMVGSAGTAGEASGSVGGSVSGSGSGFEFDGFSSFPTLESWGAM